MKTIIDEVVEYIEDFTPKNKTTSGIWSKAKSLIEKEKEQKEDFAISFAEWLGLNCYNDFSRWKMYEDDDTIFEIKQLLEIYKKEQGL